ncbi:hypothetical protein EHS25_003745 [Saitozyma podzolica]|uniref:Uncharacterized protein n=1 Tax=Saitozyma podzolica TaxID=1890683 RepID=A0A427Y394_9TREE|nr:hypothetical protein EHS25_003745 [Saitozyma podzolica]
MRSAEADGSVIPTHSASTRPLAQQYRVVRHGTRVSRKVTAPPTHGAAQREEAHGEDRLAHKHRSTSQWGGHGTRADGGTAVGVEIRSRKMGSAGVSGSCAACLLRRGASVDVADGIRVPVSAVRPKRS